MIIRRHQSIAGRGAVEVRQLLREIGSLYVSPEFTQAVLRCSEREAIRVMRALRRAGYLSNTVGDEPSLYCRTVKGSRLADASLRPISRVTAEKILQGFVERLRLVNSSHGFLHTISAAVVFGSSLSDVDRLGDVDVAVELERRPMGWETFIRRSNERIMFAQRSGKRFRNITEAVCWPTIEIWNFLKSRTKQLNIHTLGELNEFPRVKCRILLGQRELLSELLPRAEIVG